MVASKCLTTSLGKMFSDIIVLITMMKTERREAQLTEEGLKPIEDSNIKLKEGKVESMPIGSIDVKALYLSLRIKEAAKVVAEEIIKSKVDYQGGDMRIAGVYLATILPKERQSREGLARLLPQRKTRGKRGRPATLHAKELFGPMPKVVNKMETEKGEDIHMKIGEQLYEDDSVLDDVEEKLDMFWGIIAQKKEAYCV